MQIVVCRGKYSCVLRHRVDCHSRTWPGQCSISRQLSLPLVASDRCIQPDVTQTEHQVTIRNVVRWLLGRWIF